MNTKVSIATNHKFLARKKKDFEGLLPANQICLVLVIFHLLLQTQQIVKRAFQSILFQPKISQCNETMFSFAIIRGPELELATRVNIEDKILFSKKGQPASYKLPCRESSSWHFYVRPVPTK